MQSKAHRVQLVAAFSAVYLIWGSTYLGMKIAIEAIPPLPMGAVRFTTAGVLLILVLVVAGRVDLAWLRSLRYWRSAALTGTLMLVGANALLAWSLHWIPSGTAALVVACTPVWLVLLDWLQTRRGAPGWRIVVGLIFGAAGVAALAGVGSGAMAGGSLSQESFGILVATGSTLCWALGSILGRRTPQPKDLLVGAGMQMIAGGLVMSALTLLLSPWWPVEWSAAGARQWSAIAYLTIAGSMVGFTAYVWLLQNTSAARVSTYAYVNPLVAVALGWLVLSETPSTRVLIAAPVILAGVILLQWPVRSRGAATVAVKPGHSANADRRERDSTTGEQERTTVVVTPRSTSPGGDAR
ncbi:MAG: EamA family transporter [Phycisphaeraceae bacterium]|nr:EamA family transporter [Phycisphaeraceae bacterium]